MAFEIARAVPASAVILVLERHDNLRSCAYSAGVVRVSVVDDGVDSMCAPTASRVRHGHVALAELALTVRSDHDHAIAEFQLGVDDLAVGILVDGVLLETERACQPFDRSVRIAVTQARNKGRGPADIVISIRPLRKSWYWAYMFSKCSRRAGRK